MSNKILKIKRVFAWAIYNNLRSVPPKDYPTTAEIKNTIHDIFPALREHVEVYMGLIKKAEGLQMKIVEKELTAEATQPDIDEINADWRKYNREHGNEIVDVSLNEEAFKTLSDQFVREDWGKKWVVAVEEWGELSAAFDEAKK